MIPAITPKFYLLATLLANKEGCNIFFYVFFYSEHNHELSVSVDFWVLLPQLTSYNYVISRSPSVLLKYLARFRLVYRYSSQ